MSRIVMVMAVLVMVSACSSQQKQEIKDGGRQVGETTRDIGHATRDAARETGHFFRDTAKDIFGDGSADGNEEKAADDSDE